MVRIASPWAFLAVMFALAAARAPGSANVAVLVGFVGLSLWARARSAAERGRTGLGLSGGQWLRGAGIGLAMMSAAFGVAAVALSLIR